MIRVEDGCLKAVITCVGPCVGGAEPGIVNQATIAEIPFQPRGAPGDERCDGNNPVGSNLGPGIQLNGEGSDQLRVKDFITTDRGRRAPGLPVNVREANGAEIQTCST